MNRRTFDETKLERSANILGWSRRRCSALSETLGGPAKLLVGYVEAFEFPSPYIALNQILY